MRTLLFLVVVSASPVLADEFAQLPGTQPSRVTLSGDAATPSVPPPPQTFAPVGSPDANVTLSRRFLEFELRMLDLQRPSLGAPLAVTLLGGTAAVVGLSSLALASSGAYAFYVVGLVMLMGSAPFLLVGGIWLAVAVSANNRITKQVEAVEAERKALVQPSARRDESVSSASVQVATF